MFCLRSWIPILFFLKNASPIYLILFISATYFLNRPCVYCSLLLAILVVSLFDFNANWFEPSSLTALQSQAINNSGSNIIADSIAQATSSLLPDYIASGVASAMSAVTNNAVVDIVENAMGAVVARTGGAGDVSGLQGTFVEWAKGMLRKEWRVQCLDLIVRL